MGPQLTQWLAVMGAEVIKIETNLRQEVSKMQQANASGKAHRLIQSGLVILHLLTMVKKVLLST